jgi:hypothetical protein
MENLRCVTCKSFRRLLLFSRKQRHQELQVAVLACLRLIWFTCLSLRRIRSRSACQNLPERGRILEHSISIGVFSIVCYAPVLLVSHYRVPDYPQVSSGNEITPEYQLTTPQARCGAIGLNDGLPQVGMILLESERGIPFALIFSCSLSCPCDPGSNSPLQKIVHLRLPFLDSGLRGNCALRLSDK